MKFLVHTVLGCPDLLYYLMRIFVYYYPAHTLEHNATKGNANGDATASTNRFILAWTTVMLDTFIKLLEEQHDVG